MEGPQLFAPDAILPMVLESAKQGGLASPHPTSLTRGPLLIKDFLKHLCSPPSFLLLLLLVTVKGHSTGPFTSQLNLRRILHSTQADAAMRNPFAIEEDPQNPVPREAFGWRIYAVAFGATWVRLTSPT